MGLIRALAGAVGSTLSDQWKEYFYCEAMEADVLVCKGTKKVSGRSSNRHSSDVITDGSAIAVADGQCMMIVEQGKVVEVCAEPGVYTYDSGIAPTIFAGDLGESVKRTFSEIGKRFTFGGQAASDQRVYYFNTKEIMGNKYGTPTPVPFRVIDRNIGLDVDISIRCNGEYSYRIEDPILFYTNVCGNVGQEFTRSEIESQLKSELLTALQPAFARISEMGVRYSALPGHTMELADALNDVLSKKWKDLRGISIVSFGVNSVSASKEDEDMIKQLQKSAVMRDPSMAAAQLVGAQSDAMRAAASNSAGAMTGFMGMGMASQAGGMNAQDLFAMGQQQAAMRQQQMAYQQAPQQQAPAQQGGAAPKEGSWTCSCGTVNTGKFCVECGASRPAEGWVCSCGAVNKGKFCPECGAKRPAGAPVYQCDKCGWKPEDPAHPPKFCPECGDPFTDDDLVQ
ncbi:MAG: SPFH domain-containing protein [Lachnospiraceae bacterium]|nr:SPFH domain-containing protein [Lachnospiraceae bacterium]